MTTKLKKRRKSCKHGKLKRPVRTKKGGKRRCKKRSRRKRKSYKMRYDYLSVYEKQELIDRMNINDLLKFSKTSKENNILVNRRIRIIRNDLANNGLRQQEIDDILLNKQSFINFIKENRINEVRVILKYFPDYVNIKDDIYERDDWNDTALIIASAENHTEIARILLNAGADPNIQGDQGLTPLIIASDDNNIELVKMLLGKGAKPNLKEGVSNTALYYAIKRGNIEIVKMLLEKGANIYKRGPDYSHTFFGGDTIEWARHIGNTEIIELLQQYNKRRRVTNL